MKSAYPDAPAGNHGFTLIELLVVIAVIIVLVSLLATGAYQAKLKAEEAKCAMNLRQLHAAALGLIIDLQGDLPRAASCESLNDDGQWAQCHRGWVDWYDYPADKRTYWTGSQGIRCVTNGMLFPYIGDVRVYVCPTFARRSVCGVANAVRSYVMSSELSGVRLFGNPPPSRHVMFAEAAVSRFEGGTQVSGYAMGQDTWGDDYSVSFCRVGGGGAGDAQGHRSMDGMLEARDKNNGLLWSGANPWEHIGTHHAGAGYGVFGDGHTERIPYVQTVVVCDGTATNW